MLVFLRCVIQYEHYRLILRVRQEGTPRTPEETTSQVLKQFETALCSGATGKVVAAVSTTGIRDSTSSSIINTLVEMGKKLRKRDVGQPALPESEVRAKLEEELLDILQGRTHRDAINPLLGMNSERSQILMRVVEFTLVHRYKCSHGYSY
jgi:hypothetical protein